MTASLVVLVSGCSRPTRQPAARIVQPATVGGQSDSSVAITSLRGLNNLVCDDCHSSLTVDTGGDSAIAFSHELHLNMGYHCNECHKSMAHGGDIMPGHPECFTCHDDKRASRDCETCHLRRADINPHPPGFLRIHDEVAMGGQMDCRQCHTDTFCLNCHTLQMPHPRDWIQTHGRRLGTGDCARCHTREYCNRCHQRTEPASHRRRDWMRVHDDFAQRRDANCSLCHSSRFCLNCHRLPMPHPSNWTSQHARTGRTQTEVCWRCHAVEECRSCHDRRRILGHPMPFIAQHDEAARQPDPDCRVCHAPAFCARCHPSGIDGKIFPGGK